MKPYIVSIIHDPGLSYPEAEEYFSPHQAFPEYHFGHTAKNRNVVYAAVRQCLADAGLDSGNFGNATWNPLREYIHPGQNVFILCNFVKHNITRNPETMLAKCTHGSVIRAVIDYVLVALAGRGCVRFGNAPLQSADWERAVRETGAQRVQEFYARFGKGDVSVELVDLRQDILRRSAIGMVEPIYHCTEAGACVAVDLGSDSLLDELYKGNGNPQFRVLDYDQRRTKSFHSKGCHVFLVNKLILDSDVIISVPKLKTHEKVGLTCGLKGCVGTVGRKDCLAHHRYGPPHCGGDEYPDRLSVLRVLSRLHDATYGRQADSFQKILQLLNHWSRIAVRRFTRALSGSWPGNDTCWRMALDLARIVEYATEEGRLESARRRTHIMLTDGVVAGEGDGPLSPRPVSLGYVSFSDNVAVGDYVNCLAMGFRPEKIPMIRQAFALDTYRLVKTRSPDITVRINKEVVAVKDVAPALGRKFVPPREWRRYL